MTTTEKVRSETILQEVRARVLTLVKSPPADPQEVPAWEAVVKTLGQLEMIYSRPESIPIEKPPILQRIE